MRVWLTLVAALITSAALLGCRTGGEVSAADAPVHVAPTEEDRALAERVRVAVDAAQGTPAQEAANYIQYDWVQRELKMLTGEVPATADELRKARRTARELAENTSKGPTWPRPGTIDVPRAAGPVTIDGRLDDPAWQHAATFTGVYRFNQREHLDQPATTWHILWDDEYLYFAFDCADRDLVAPEVPRDDPVYTADCVEMFILPSFRTGVYWELVIGPSGSVFDAIQSKQFNRWGPVSQQNRDLEGLKLGRTVRGTLNDSSDTDQGYTIEVAVPFAELPEYSRAEPAAGQTLHLMLVRLDRNGETFDTYAFVPLLSWGHNIWNHAPIRLVGPQE